MAEFDEAADVGVSVEDEVVFLGFDLIPEDVDGDGIEAEGFDLFDAIFPEFGWDASGMDFPGDETDGLGVDDELLVFEFEFVRFFRRGGGLRHRRVEERRLWRGGRRKRASGWWRRRERA